MRGHRFYDLEYKRWADAAEEVDAQMGYRAPIAWQSWTPALDCYSTATTAPTLGTSPVQRGSYMHDPHNNICEVDFQIQFGPSGGPSGGVSPAIIVGPLPVAMATGVPGWGNTSGNDREVGGGYVAKGSTFYVPEIPIIWMQSDIAGKTGGGNNYQYLQAFCPVSWEHGTATISTSVTFIAVTFVNALPNAPNPSDISVIETSNVLSGGRGFWLTSVGTTGFTINVETTPASALTFDWTVRSQATQLMSPTYPWNVGANADRISGSVRYQTNA